MDVNNFFQTNCQACMQLGICSISKTADRLVELARKDLPCQFKEEDKKLDTPYHTQKNNPLFPYATCGTTITNEYLSFKGFNQFTDDDVFIALSRPQMIDRANAYIQKGDKYIKSLLSKRTGTNFNYLNNSMIMLTEVAKFLTDYKVDFAVKYGTFEQIKQCLNEGFPVGVAGKFTSEGHYVLLVGHKKDSFYADDPAGNWNTSYADANGAKVLYSQKKLDEILYKDSYDKEKILYFRAY